MRFGGSVARDTPYILSRHEAHPAFVSGLHGRTGWPRARASPVLAPEPMLVSIIRSELRLRDDVLDGGFGALAIDFA